MLQIIDDSEAINIIRSWLDTELFDAEIGLPYGNTISIDGFFDVHGKIRLLQNHIRIQMQRNGALNVSIELAMNFEKLKRIKFDSMYRECPLPGISIIYTDGFRYLQCFAAAFAVMLPIVTFAILIHL